jgi:hypothetical protein
VGWGLANWAVGWGLGGWGVEHERLARGLGDGEAGDGGEVERAHARGTHPLLD